MTKRRVASDSDDESSPSYANSPASKKPRTQSNGAHASLKKNNQIIAVDSDEVVEVEDNDVAESSEAEEPNGAPAATEEDQEAEETKFEEEHGDKIRQYLDAKRTHLGVCIDI